MSDLLSCPYSKCDGSIVIEGLREDDLSLGYSFHCKSCGGYIKNKSTYQKATDTYNNLVRKWDDTPTSEEG